MGTDLKPVDCTDIALYSAIRFYLLVTATFIYKITIQFLYIYNFLYRG